MGTSEGTILSVDFRLVGNVAQMQLANYCSPLASWLTTLQVKNRVDKLCLQNDKVLYRVTYANNLSVAVK